jgi:hypothetical protein
MDTLEVLDIFPSGEAAAAQGFHKSAICMCAKGNRKSHGGFYWRYSDGHKVGDKVK